MKNLFNKILNILGAGNMFFVSVLLIYVIILIFNYNVFISSIISSYKMFTEIVWILFFVIFIMIISDLVLNKKVIMRLFNKKKNILSYLLIIGAGILSAGPIYMWYPLLMELKEKGLGDRYITIFLYNRAIKLALIPAFIAFFNITLAIVLFSVMVVFSVINGLIVEYIVGRKEIKKNK